MDDKNITNDHNESWRDCTLSVWTKSTKCKLPAKHPKHLSLAKCIIVSALW